MRFELQPQLENDLVRVTPLKQDDFETLYNVASDPLIWEQHPNKYRYKREAFENYFRGAIESGGAFLVFDVKTGQPVGCSRFYEYNQDKSSIAIGYTFLARSHWGTTYNKALKELMLDHSFKFVDNVFFHVGAINVRSQKAIERLGAKKVDEIEMEYYGEPKKLNYIYRISKTEWTHWKLK
jgi:RimJ/RimL family protein N-acetyltransferase